MTAQMLTERLREIHGDLCHRFPSASASYMAVYVTASRGAVVLHAGDCLLGTHGPGSSINWLSRPRTLANAVGDASVASIAKVPARHPDTQFSRPGIHAP